MLTYTVNELVVTITHPEPITSGSVGLPLTINFDSSWTGRSKILVFQFINLPRQQKSKSVFEDFPEVLTREMTLGGATETTITTTITERIPFPNGKFRIGVYGTVADTTGAITRCTPTCWSPELKIYEGAEPTGVEAKPTEALVEQIYELAQSVRDDADAGEFDGTSAGFGTPTITVDSGTGTPYATVTASGPDTAKIFAFEFHNLKGGGGTGVDDKHYTYEQSTPASTWTINHNLSKYPSVMVVDYGKNDIEPDIHYIDANNVELKFYSNGAASNVSGYAYLN